MPAGVISLTMCSDQYSVSLRPVTYYTNMGEVSRYLEAAADPVNFICQVRNIPYTFPFGGVRLFLLH